jgi:hypothetical protein
MVKERQTPIGNSYTLPRDWWGAQSFVWWLYILLFFGLYKLFDFIRTDIAAGVKYGFQEIWSIFIAVALTLGVSALIIWLISRMLKKRTIVFTKEGLSVNNKETIKWDDLVGYKKNDKSVTLMDYKDVPHYFYTGDNLNYYVEESLKNFIKKIPEKSKEPKTKIGKIFKWVVSIIIFLIILFIFIAIIFLR